MARTERPAITNEQRAELAYVLMTQAGNIVEFWNEFVKQHPKLDGVDTDTAKDVLGRWLSRLPGEAWDARLTDPNAPPTPPTPRTPRRTRWRPRSTRLPGSLVRARRCPGQVAATA